MMLEEFEAWASQFDPGEIEKREAWLLTRTPTDEEAGSTMRVLENIRPGDTPLGYLTALDAATEMRTEQLLSERNPDGSFKFTSKEVWSAICSAVAGTPPNGAATLLRLFDSRTAQREASMTREEFEAWVRQPGPGEIEAREAFLLTGDALPGGALGLVSEMLLSERNADGTFKFTTREVKNAVCFTLAGATPNEAIVYTLWKVILILRQLAH